jgi:hypothetical protein
MQLKLLFGFEVFLAAMPILACMLVFYPRRTALLNGAGRKNASLGVFKPVAAF